MSSTYENCAKNLSRGSQNNAYIKESQKLSETRTNDVGKSSKDVFSISQKLNNSSKDDDLYQTVDEVQQNKDTKASNNMKFAFGFLFGFSIVIGTIAIALACSVMLELNSTKQELTKLTETFSKSIAEINNSIKLLSNQLEKVDDSVEMNSYSLKLMDESLNAVNESVQTISNSLEKMFDEVFTNEENNKNAVLRGYEELDDGWIAPFNGYHYKINPNPLTWEESRGACKSLGGDLIDFGFRDFGTRITIIRAFGKITSSSSHWIGLSDSNGADNWYWVNDQRANTEDGSFWAPGYPSSGTDYDCGYTIISEGHSYEFFALNIYCSRSYPSICEKFSDVKTQ